ncbi:MAG TPA: hypothetical protein VFQ00_13425 [Terriglobales bacterium]|nr:hypothetical protein [Terriglobales bacterium]
MIILALASVRLLGQDCRIYNESVSPLQNLQVNTAEHITGNHYFVGTTSGSCIYSSPSGAGGWCTVRSSATAIANTYEAGVLATIADQHVTGRASKGGTAYGVNGESASAQSQADGAIKSCFDGLCSVNITISASPVPGFGGLSASFPPDDLWNAQSDNFSMDCGAEQEEPSPTPIVIDTNGEGFHLTSADNGVTFDILADGKPLQISWTDPRYHNGWLVLDRNGNGTIDSGAELFGDVTPQPQVKGKGRANGYKALAVFDTPAAGGNGDGIIDVKDAVFSHLRVWIDANHDGVSQPEELHTLPELGIQMLALKYHSNDYEDGYGNHFRFQSYVNDQKDRKDYDVFLVRK